MSFMALRLLALGTWFLFSLIVLGISAHIIVVTEQVGIDITFSIVAAAIAAKTLAIFSFIFLRRHAAPVKIIVEVCMLGLFWVSWLATAVYTAYQLFFLPIDCNFDFVVNDYYSFSCHEPHVVHAFSWINWAILTAYWPFLLIMAFVQKNRGNPVWTKPIDEVDMFAPPAVVATQVSRPQQQRTMMNASQPMQQQPRMGYPPNTPGTTYPPTPTQSGFAPTLSPQAGYTPTLMMYTSQPMQQQPQMGYSPNTPGTTPTKSGFAPSHFHQAGYAPMMSASQPMRQQPQMGYPPNASGTTCPPVPVQGGFTLTQFPQADYTPAHVMYVSQPVQQQPQMSYTPNTPGTTYPPVPVQTGFAPYQSHQAGYTHAPTMNPPQPVQQQPHMNTPGTTYPPDPVQSGVSPTQSPQAGHVHAPPPQKPQQVYNGSSTEV